VPSTLAPLEIRGFRRLLTSYVANQLGDSIALIALSVLVFDESDSALATAALFVSMKFVPAFIAPAVIAALDQRPINRVLASIYGAEAIVFAVIAVFAKDYVLSAVLALAFVDGVLALAARGLSRGAVAALLEPSGLLREGNALMNVGFGLSIVVGMALGGLIVSGSGASTGLMLNAGSFAIIAVLVAGLRQMEGKHAEPEPFLQRIRAGAAHVRRHRLLPLLLTGQALALIFFYLVIPIEVVYAKRTLDVGDVGFGILLASWSLGIFVGSLAYVRLSRRSPAALVLGATAAIGVAYIGMSLTTELWVACTLSVFGGIGNGFQWVSVMTLIQEETPVDLQARVVGLLESVGAAMPGVGFLLGGTLTAVWSASTAYAVAGSGVLVIALIGVVTLRNRLSARTGSSPSHAATLS
jgi:MFS family permease